MGNGEWGTAPSVPIPHSPFPGIPTPHTPASLTLPGSPRPMSFPAMRKLLLAIGVLLAAHVALLFVRPSGAFEAPEGDALDVGIVFDVGGKEGQGGQEHQGSDD